MINRTLKNKIAEQFASMIQYIDEETDYRYSEQDIIDTLMLFGDVEETISNLNEWSLRIRYIERDHW